MTVVGDFITETKISKYLGAALGPNAMEHSEGRFDKR